MPDDRRKPKRTLLDRLGDGVRELLEDLVEAVDSLVEPPRAPVPIRPGRR
jgi:hypothetical protein